MPLRASSFRWLMLFGVAGSAMAEGLLPLRVDATLLGALPPRAIAAPVASQGDSPIVQKTVLPATPSVARDMPTATSQSAEPPAVAERPLLAPLYSAHAAAGELPAPVLRPTKALAPQSHDDALPRPNFVSADSIHGRTDIEMIAEGAAQLRKVGTVLDADRLTYWHLDDEVEALGNVRLERDQDVFTGPKLRMKVEENVGFFDQPRYEITRQAKVVAQPGTAPTSTPLPRSTVTGYGNAERVDFKGEGLFHLNKATYSTCAPGNGAWHAEVAELDLDYGREVAEGSDGKLVFKGVPILYSPWLSFSLNNERKSGLLAPTIGSTSRSGFETTLPWYWNIAPNMDATIAPRVLTKRGTQWNSEFNYLDYRYSGQARIEYLPDDHVTNRRRSSYAVLHNQNFGNGLSGSLNLNGVSDDAYLSDMSTRLAVTSQANLLRQGQLVYGSGWWSATLTGQSYQTLQDPSQPPVALPYRRLPQVNLTASRPDLPYGTAFNFGGEFVKFGHPTDVIGQRTTAYPQLSLPLQTAAFQITPKLGLSLTQYQLSRQAAGVPATLSRSQPIASVDAGVVFERPLDWWGRGLTQTLEPRLYYLYVPQRDQQLIPVFDSSVADFNFAQIFAENRYSGGDRIADANQMTAAATSRLIDPATGAELIRGLVGQRYYFSAQHVALPGETPRSGRSADMLAAVSGQFMPKTWVDTGWQYNPRDGRTERFNAGGRYQPELGKVLNAGYRYTRDLLGQIDVSGQWPLQGGWHGIGRYNYSTRDKHLIETVGGLEYDGGCWMLRLVMQRIATQTQQSNTSFFVQLELNGFSRLGSNPLELLKRNIPGYGLINQPVADPVFAAQ